MTIRRRWNHATGRYELVEPEGRTLGFLAILASIAGTWALVIGGLYALARWLT